MKKNLITALIIVIVTIAICWCLKKTVNQNFKPTVTGVSPATNTFILTSNLSPQVIVQPTNELIVTNAPTELVISNYENLSDLAQIKSFHEVNGFLHLRNWYSEGNPVIFQLKSVNGELTGFKADTIWALTDRKTDHVRQLDLHSPWLDINEARQDGSQLEEAWGLDAVGFLAWCNKVGNN